MRKIKSKIMKQKHCLKLYIPRRKPEFDFSKIDTTAFLKRSLEYFESDDFKELKEDLAKSKKLREIYKKKPCYVFEYRGYKCKIIRTKEGFWSMFKRSKYDGLKRLEPNPEGKWSEVKFVKEEIDYAIEHQNDKVEYHF